MASVSNSNVLSNCQGTTQNRRMVQQRILRSRSPNKISKTVQISYDFRIGIDKWQETIGNNRNQMHLRFQTHHQSTFDCALLHSSSQSSNCQFNLRTDISPSKENCDCQSVSLFFLFVLMLYYVVLCCIMLYYVVLCCIMLYYVVLCCIMLYYVVLCCIMLYYVVLCCIMLYYVVLCCIILYSFVLQNLRAQSLPSCIQIFGFQLNFDMQFLSNEILCNKKQLTSQFSSVSTLTFAFHEEKHGKNTFPGLGLSEFIII